MLLASDADVASMNIRSRLIEEAEWEPSTPCWDRMVLRRDGLLLMERPGIHLDFTSVDREVSSYLRSMGPGLDSGAHNETTIGPDRSKGPCRSKYLLQAEGPFLPRFDQAHQLVLLGTAQGELWNMSGELFHRPVSDPGTLGCLFRNGRLLLGR